MTAYFSKVPVSWSCQEPEACQVKKFQKWEVALDHCSRAMAANQPRREIHLGVFELSCAI